MAAFALGDSMASRVAERERDDAHSSTITTERHTLVLVVAHEVKKALDAAKIQELRASAGSSGRKRGPSTAGLNTVVDEQHQHKRRIMVHRLELARDQQAQLASFLQQRQTAQALSQDADVDYTAPPCTICLGGMHSHATDGDAQLEALSCGHVFHQRCIRRWVSYNRCCPIDRQSLD